MTEVLSVQVTTAETYAVVAVVGEIDIASVPVLQEAIDTLIVVGTRHLVVDLEGVGFMDSSGLNTLVGVVKRLGSGSVGVANCRPQIRRIFDITGLDQIIRLFDSLGAAIDAAPRSTAPERME